MVTNPALRFHTDCITHENVLCMTAEFFKAFFGERLHKIPTSQHFVQERYAPNLYDI